ncbi:hypothetical protein J7E70_32650 [Variovorax paradoxus]|nr:hypothetical protein [Variovorax paradoxus]MBT2305158.1 hypothetical protein [Variovorax paradoxus]
MEPSLILRTSTLLLVFTALTGVVMAGIRFFGKGDRRPPTSLAMLHGFLAAASLTLLLYAAATIAVPRMTLAAIVLLVLALAGGVILNLNYHLKGLLLPKGLIVVHAIAALAGFLLIFAAAST